MTAFGNQITEACKCRESVFAHWRLTWGSLVDRLYQIIEAHALGSWLTLEIITTGKELVWREKRTQSVNAAEENDNALLGFVFFLSFSCQPKHCSLAWLFLRSGAGPAVGNVCLACLRWDVGFQKVVSTQVSWTWAASSARSCMTAIQRNDCVASCSQRRDFWQWLSPELVSKVHFRHAGMSSAYSLESVS